VTANTDYVVSYLAPQGNYSYTSGYFAQTKNSGPLSAPSGANGQYLYGAAGGFPQYSWNSTNYFVDVVYAPTVTTPPPPPAPAPGVSIFSDTATPANPAWQDGAAVQLGVRFAASVAGSITGIRFYKAAGDAGTHTAYLWSATGTQLASASFTSETASGWQDVYFPTPVAITAGTEYRASYYTTNATYAIDLNGLTDPVVNGPLSTIANGGSYTYSKNFPNNTVSHNYWVDVHFVAAQ
jgi:hypothetical protein